MPVITPVVGIRQRVIFRRQYPSPIGSTPLAMYGSPWAASYRARSDPPNTRARFRAHPMGSTSSFNMTLSSRPRMAQSKRSRRFWKRTAHGRFPGISSNDLPELDAPCCFLHDHPESAECQARAGGARRAPPAWAAPLRNVAGLNSRCRVVRPLANHYHRGFDSDDKSVGRLI